MRYDPSSPEEQEKFRQGLIAKGWTYHERLGTLVPPGTTEEDIDKTIVANKERAEKFRQAQENSNRYIFFLVSGLIAAIWIAPWIWLVLAVGVMILGFVAFLGGYKGSSDEGPGGAGKLGPF